MKSFHKLSKFLLAICVFSTISVKAETFGLLMKPYIGVDYTPRVAVDGESLKSQNCSISSDLTSLENFGAGAGLRIHRNLGVEYKYTKLSRENEKDVKFDYKIHSADLLFYAPAFDVIGTSLEFFAGVGQSTISAVGASDDATKVQIGLETRLLGLYRVFVGYEKIMNVNLGPQENDIDIVKVGVSYFLW